MQKSDLVLPSLSRRQALGRLAILGTASAATLSGLPIAAQAAAPTAASAAPDGPFKLAPLPYPADALEPHIDAQTMQIHHGKHHAAYVANLNKAVAGQSGLAGKTAEQLVRELDQVPEAVRTAVRNNGGGHVNHSFFWQSLKKNEGGKPTGELKAAIDKSFQSYDGFREQFTKSAMSVFGSGWAWLCRDREGALRIVSTPNQDSVLTQGHVPLLGLDVWEHAYYLKYQNRRADYVAAFFNVINWDFVAEQHRR